MTDEENARGIDGYYKWVDGKWKLYNGTANDDPELDPDFHKPAGNDEYMYDDNASSVKLKMLITSMLLRAVLGHVIM